MIFQSFSRFIWSHDESCLLIAFLRRLFLSVHISRKKVIMWWVQKISNRYKWYFFAEKILIHLQMIISCSIHKFYDWPHTIHHLLERLSLEHAFTFTFIKYHASIYKAKQWQLLIICFMSIKVRYNNIFMYIYWRQQWNGKLWTNGNIDLISSSVWLQ